MLSIQSVFNVLSSSPQDHDIHKSHIGTTTSSCWPGFCSFAACGYTFAPCERISAGCEFVFARREQRFVQASNKFTVCHKRFYSMNPADLSYKYNTQTQWLLFTQTAWFSMHSIYEQALRMHSWERKMDFYPRLRYSLLLLRYCEGVIWNVCLNIREK